jgi:hypothetical protein
VLARKGPNGDSLAVRVAEPAIDRFNRINGCAAHERASRAADFKLRTLEQTIRSHLASHYRHALASALLIGSLE